MLAGGAMSWRSRKQTFVATSSCEAEYIASCLATKEAFWLSRLLSDIHGYGHPPALTIRIDNSGSISHGPKQLDQPAQQACRNTVPLLRDCVAAKKVAFEFVSSENHVADPLTKPLDSVKTENHTAAMGAVPLNS